MNILNEHEFRKQYNNALIKGAIGVHVIRTAGANLEFDETLQTSNITSICVAIADGFNLAIETVTNDVMETYDMMPSIFLKDPSIFDYIRELEIAYKQQGLLTA